MPITPDTMMNLLTAACPSYRPIWEAFQQEWQHEPDLPYYVALGDLADHLIERLELQDFATLTEVFRVVEQLHVEGDAYVQEAATIGLLEDLQNTALHRHTQPAQFYPLLLPVSATAWNQLYEFWEGYQSWRANRNA